MLTSEHHKKVVSNNGIFWPVIVVYGQAISVWKRIIKKDKVHIETNFFNKPDDSILKAIEQAAHRYIDFLNKESVIS